MKYLGLFFAAIFGLLLPLHGGLTVFLPWLRWWKEVLLLTLLIVVVYNEAKKIGCIYFDQPKNCHSGLNSGSLFSRYLQTWNKPQLLAVGLLVWLIFLVLMDAEKIRAMHAVRYLSLLPLVYLIVSRFLRFDTARCVGAKMNLKNNSHLELGSGSLISLQKKVNTKIPDQVRYDHKFAHYFCSCFLLSVCISIIFGVWVKFGNGPVFVQEFYSNTVSSWVPGQTLPMWHEINGIMRMQGLSSGPVAFGHMCLLALGILPIWLRKICQPELDSRSSLFSLQKENKKLPDQVVHDRIYINIFVQIICSLFLVWSIFHSGSRAALLAALILVVWQMFWQMQKVNYKIVRNVLLFFCLIGVISFGGFISCFIKTPFSSPLSGRSQLCTPVKGVLARAGTSDHFTRPVAAVQKFFASPIIGNLGELGPAARAWNLKHHNNDQALIAENVYVDYLAQTGLLGFGLFMSFFLTAIYGVARRWRGILLVFALSMSMATLLDMTPLAITVGIILGVNQSAKNN